MALFKYSNNTVNEPEYSSRDILCSDSLITCTDEMNIRSGLNVYSMRTLNTVDVTDLTSYNGFEDYTLNSTKGFDHRPFIDAVCGLEIIIPSKYAQCVKNMSHYDSWNDTEAIDKINTISFATEEQENGDIVYFDPLFNSLKFPNFLDYDWRHNSNVFYIDSTSDFTAQYTIRRLFVTGRIKKFIQESDKYSYSQKTDLGKIEYTDSTLRFQTNRFNSDYTPRRYNVYMEDSNFLMLRSTISCAIDTTDHAFELRLSRSRRNIRR